MPGTRVSGYYGSGILAGRGTRRPAVDPDLEREPEGRLRSTSCCPESPRGPGHKPKKRSIKGRNPRGRAGDRGLTRRDRKATSSNRTPASTLAREAVPALVGPDGMPHEGMVLVYAAVVRSGRLDRFVVAPGVIIDGEPICGPSRRRRCHGGERRQPKQVIHQTRTKGRSTPDRLRGEMREAGVRPHGLVGDLTTGRHVRELPRRWNASCWTSRNPRGGPSSVSIRRRRSARHTAHERRSHRAACVGRVGVVETRSGGEIRDRALAECSGPADPAVQCRSSGREDSVGMTPPCRLVGFRAARPRSQHHHRLARRAHTRGAL